MTTTAMSDEKLVKELDFQLEYEDLHAPLEAAIMAVRNRLANYPKAAQAPAGDGWVMVPREPTPAMLERAAFNLCAEYGVEFVEPLGQFVKDAYAELLSALPPAPPAGDGWRGMETAPRKGLFIGAVDGMSRLISWGKTSHVPFYGWCLADQGAEDFDLCEPTAWRPLPPAPAANTTEET